MFVIPIIRNNYNRKKRRVKGGILCIQIKVEGIRECIEEFYKIEKQDLNNLEGVGLFHNLRSLYVLGL